MKKYRLKVNGKVFEVELEAIEEVKATPAPEVKKEEVKAAPTPVASKGNRDVIAPIGGVVVKVNVKVGDNVKKGQVLLLIEAMKLENEVVSPVEGKVIDIKVKSGDNVQTKDLLVILG